MKVIFRKSEAKEPFSFVFADNEGKTIIKSENYKAKQSALNGIESVRKNSQIDKHYELKESKNGKFYFNLIASNGQVVGNSPLFDSKNALDAAIELLKKNAPQAEIEEEA